MPASRGSDPAGVDPAKVADWRRRAFRRLRPPAFAGLDARLPVEPLDDPASALELDDG